MYLVKSSPLPEADPTVHAVFLINVSSTAPQTVQHSCPIPDCLENARKQNVECLDQLRKNHPTEKDVSWEAYSASVQRNQNKLIS